MNIKQIINKTNDVKPYQKGTAEMWTDEHISGQLLNAHINANNNLASRKGKNIKKIIDWIISQYGKKEGRILDLGCGPGLYTQRLAQKGYDVTGVDFSENSIAYAKKTAKENDLPIQYHCMNYLDIDYIKEFDVIIIIYLDFGALTIKEREVFIKNVYRALKPGGIFIFDALNQYSKNNESENKSWELSEGGFWQKKPYICLYQRLQYEGINSFVDKHLVINEEGEFKTYHFWNHYFSYSDVEKMFIKHGFTKMESYDNFARDNTYHNNEDVTFYKISK